MGKVVLPPTNPTQNTTLPTPQPKNDGKFPASILYNKNYKMSYPICRHSLPSGQRALQKVIGARSFRQSSLFRTGFGRKRYSSFYRGRLLLWARSCSQRTHTTHKHHLAHPTAKKWRRCIQKPHASGTNNGLFVLPPFFAVRPTRAPERGSNSTAFC